MGSMKSWDFQGFSFRILFGVCFIFMVIWPVNGLRPLRQRRSWGEEVSAVCVCVSDDKFFGSSHCATAAAYITCFSKSVFFFCWSSFFLIV